LAALVELVAMRIAYPSAGSRTNAAVPMLPPAPARLSTTTATPSSCDSGCAMMRAMASVAPPGDQGTMNLIGLVGQVCAIAAGNVAASPTAAIARNKVRRTLLTIIDLPCVVCLFDVP
jgi:hypothetical protein